MINEEIIAFIQEQRSLGTDNDTIVTRLQANGWQDGDIAAAYETIAASDPAPLPPQEAETAQEPLPGTDPVTNPSSDTLRIVGIGLALIAIVALFFFFSKTKEPSASIPSEETKTVAIVPLNPDTSCGNNDWDCVIAAAKTCNEPRSSLVTRSDDFFVGTLMSVTQYGVSPSKSGCMLSIETKKVWATTSDGKPSKESAAISKSLEGRKGMCAFMKKDDLVTALTHMKEGTGDMKVSCVTKGTSAKDPTTCTVEGEDFKNATCSGTIFESFL